MKHPLTSLVGVLALGLTLTLTGCGSDNSDSGMAMDGTSAPAADTGHNEADVSFATEMIQHHKQALDMVEMTSGRQLDPAVRTLADDIKAAQAPEIQTMNGWLSSWGTSTPSASASHDMGDMGDMESMPGMMTDDEMSSLEKAPDADFQKMWLQMMVKHHQGAVQMAQTEQNGGEYQPAVDLAGKIIADQNKEIATMTQLIASS
ncbi:DUF305 domain-containing protein [Nocardioides sp. Kera G14]|uniref:DUF305 domain-containing protein n=1 Tax=Nocardioides sp. Kera G14 TaxID=2884264 RepID=UPI001D0FDE00|nr:DUF305 domain-containing protein [Nocardioides sp. Kera G14]UDY24013.1 DUF305 domain-containing protein [Nocardioides sp. Kera G14]